MLSNKEKKFEEVQ